MTEQIATGTAPGWLAGGYIQQLMRTTLFFAFAGLILLGPFAAQILRINSPIFRPWTMFSGVGVGIPKGEFRAVAHDGTITQLKPLEVLGLERYPVMLSFEFHAHAADEDGLRRFASAYCSRNDVKLSFRGFVGSRQGWQPVEADNICAAGR